MELTRSSLVRRIIAHLGSLSNYSYVQLLTILAFVILVRLPFAFARIQHADEGTYVTYGAQTTLRSDVFGIDYVDGRGPGGYLIYALLVKVFGFDTVKHHLVSILYMVVITVLVYLSAKLLFSDRVALLTTLTYTVFSFSFNLPDSTFLNVEMMALLPLMASLYIYAKIIVASSHSRYQSTLFALLGLSLGLVFSIRQAMAIALPVFIGHYCLLSRNSRRMAHLLRWMVLACLGFIGGICLGYIHPILHGGLTDALYATAVHGFKFPVSPWTHRAIRLAQRAAWFGLTQPFLWCGVMIAFFDALYSRRSVLFLPFALLFAEALGLLVMGRVGAHYFHAVIPFACLIVGWQCSEIWWKSLSYQVKVLVLIAGLLVPLLHFMIFPVGVLVPEYSVVEFFREKATQQDPIALAARYVAEHTTPEQSIQCLNSTYAFMQFYVLAERLPAARIVHPDFAQIWSSDDLANQLNTASPEFIVLPSPKLGGMSSGQLAELLAQNYRLDRTFVAEESFYYRFYLRKLTPLDARGDEIYVKVYKKK